MSDPRLVTPGQANPHMRNFYDAVQNLNMTPQEQNLYMHGIRNQYMGGSFNQPGGELSTILQSVVTGPDGRYYNIPTVWQGQMLPIPLATQMARSYGWDHWPSYPSADAADSRYMAMHAYMDRDPDTMREDQHGSTPRPDGGSDQPDIQRPLGQAPGDRQQGVP